MGLIQSNMEQMHASNLRQSECMSSSWQLTLSLLWRYFTLETKSKTVTCSVCLANVSRGGSNVVLYKTTN